jgi:ribosomal protein L16 Arg81 hydroxylase
MSGQAITFRDMLAPVSAEDFFEHHYDSKPLYISGGSDKFSAVFSWHALNALLNMPNVWTSRTVKLARDGVTVPAEQFCRPVYGREGQTALEADPAKVRRHLREGATLVLDFVECLSPTVASVAGALQVWFGGPATCNLYCSWQAQQGFASHFDTTDVIVLQIVGSKKWRVYQGRFEQPVEAPGFETTGYPQEFHEEKKGEILMTPELTPGDLLYLPRGQYHDALTSTEASLHLTFGVTQATGHDVLMQLADAFVDDPLFRKPFPSFDDEAAHDAHVRALADRMREIIADPEASDALRGFQHDRAFLFCYPQYDLPDRKDPVIYRVQSLGARLVRRGAGHQLQTQTGKEVLGDAEAKVAAWVLSRDFFSGDELAETARGQGLSDASTAADTLRQAGLIAPIGQGFTASSA